MYVRKKEFVREARENFLPNNLEYTVLYEHRLRVRIDVPTDIDVDG